MSFLDIQNININFSYSSLHYNVHMQYVKWLISVFFVCIDIFISYKFDYIDDTFENIIEFLAK